MSDRKCSRCGVAGHSKRSCTATPPAWVQAMEAGGGAPGGGVVDAAAPLEVPAGATSITVAADGTVNATIQGQTAPSKLGQLQLASFVNPAGLNPLGGNIYAETAASGTPNTGAPGANGNGSVQQGYVEGSNVNVVQELVNMIATQRAYELNSKAITTSDQMLQKLGQM